MIPIDAFGRMRHVSAMRKAKIVCTIGPASDNPATLGRLIESGMDVARLNFSHGTHDSHRGAIDAIRAAAERRGAPVAILQDLQGPRIRVGALPDEGLRVAEGQHVRLTGGMVRSGGQLGAQATASSPVVSVPVTYPQLVRDVRPGSRILIDDGLIELSVTGVSGGSVDCVVKTGGVILSHKGINAPGTAISAPTLTDKDRADIRMGIELGVDLLALSFVRGPEDIAAARRLIAEYGGDQPLIAKIERAEAVTALADILTEADGVMIARGDLGVELGPEAVPVLQKRIIAEANRRRRLVITATQMLESMTRNLRPTRAEASDVANAVFDGTDAVMLSAETAKGRYPVEAVQVMDRVVRAAEAERTLGWTDRTPRGTAESIPEAMCAAASSTAAAAGAAALAVFTESGATARLLSKQRPAAPVVAFTPHETVLRRMALYWGVMPRLMARIEDPDERVRAVERRLKEEKLVESGRRIVLLSGTVTGQPGGTNAMKLQEIA